MFDAADRAERNAAFLRSSEIATRIIAMSDSVQQDFQLFAPKYAWKVRVLPPASYIDPRVYQVDPLAITKLYNLPEKFIYLPNQWWKHKNHELVLRAVRSLKDRGVDVCVVCTGNLNDYRHPLQSAELFQKLSRWGIRDRVIYLGLVPRREVLALMRQSVCVLNPSLFEGWGYSIDEARSLGKRVLLSDIPAHRDQDPPQATFFDPVDCEDLTAKLAEVWFEAQPGPDTELEAEARRLLPRRRKAYAEQFVAIAQEAMATVRG
jgi:glycosyltransferase involved in cell wall biosynthesis